MHGSPAAANATLAPGRNPAPVTRQRSSGSEAVFVRPIPSYFVLKLLTSDFDEGLGEQL